MANDKRSLAFGFLGNDMGLGKTLKGLAKDSDHAHSSLSRLGKVVIGAGAVAGVALLSKKVIDFGKNTVDSYTHAAKSAGALQRIIGGTVEDASRLGFAAHEAGVSEESFSKSLRLLEKNLGAATKAQIVKTKHTHQEIVTVNRLKDGHIVHVKALKNVTDWTSRTVKVSKDLGFTYKDAHGALLPMRDIMLNVADKFQKMPNGIEKTSLALKLFGRAGTDMIPILNRGRDGVADLMKESDKLGTTMSAKDVKAVKEYTLQQRHLHAAMEGLKITLGRELFPIFTAWSDSLAKNAPKILAWTKTHLPEFKRRAGEVASFIKTDLEPAVSNFVDGLVTEGTKIEKEVAPFFHWLGDHPDLMKEIGKDALVLGGVLKAKSFLTGLGLLKGLSGAKLGGVGAVGGLKTPLPVFVTNAGFGPGGGKTPVPVGGGKLGAAEKIGTGALLKRAVAGPVGGIASVLITSGDEAKGGAAKQQEKAVRLFLAKHSNVPQNDPQFYKLLDAAAGKHSLSDSGKFDKNPSNLAQFQFLQRYGQTGDKSVRAMEAQLLHDKSVRAYFAEQQGQRADQFLDDPKRGRALRNDTISGQRDLRGSDLTRLLTPGMGAKVTNVTNNYFNLSGPVQASDPDTLMAALHRKARIAAVGGISNPATRDRG